MIKIKQFSTFFFSYTSDHYFIRWVFLKFLGLIYFIAFVSLGVQIQGLIGSEGILPAGTYLSLISNSFGPERYILFPTLFWLHPTDGFLTFLWVFGAFSAILLILGIMPVVMLTFLWAFYLSLCTIGQDFLNFQWDVLLLEVGFLSIFFAPFQLWPDRNKESPPPRIILWLYHWLLFRLMFSSGMVKLLSGDPTWRSFTALNYHYETQPLPTALAWYMHQLPEIFQKFSVFIMFVIELVIPFFIFASRRFKFFAFCSLVLLQGLIIATGNYCFFNILTIALTLLLLDDSAVKKIFPGLKRLFRCPPNPQVHYSLLAKNTLVLFTFLIFFLSIIQFSSTVLRNVKFPAAVYTVLRWSAPFRTVNRYGLFAVMTTVRNEIIVEGSNDRQNWRAYEFKWKPGDLARKPGRVAPHQPRLDWQMWFAALRPYQQVPWFMNFLYRLLTGSPEVLALLKKNPFPVHPPKYIRALFYEYHFTNLKEKRTSGNWWRRELKGLYCPIIYLKNRLQPELIHKGGVAPQSQKVKGLVGLNH